jgi:hypothetical protein
MLRSRIGRVATSALLVGTTIFALAGPAQARPGIACKVLTGNIATNVTLKRCTGNTGGASQPMVATSLATGGKITWVNGKTTTVKLTVTQNADSSACKATESRYDARGKTTADTTGSVIIGGRVKASVCVDNGTGAIRLVPLTKATFA